jgi:hypothetical protein
MSQNRPPPAYMEYAAAMLANVQYRTMSLGERGLLDTMRRECWVNHSLPNNPAVLARVLGFDTQQIEDTLPCVMSFFRVVESQIICPELEDYRSHLLAIREKQSEGGKRGASLTNQGKRKPASRAHKGFEGKPPGDLKVYTQDKSESLVQSNPIQIKSTPSLDTDDIDPWVSDYEKASNGN